MKLLLLSILLILISCFKAQAGGYCVAIIEYQGNERTNEQVLDRELTIESEECFPSLKALESEVQKSKKNINNTQLFTEVNHNIDGENPKQTRIVFDLRERWYIFPEPTFDISDRNFNEWWNTHNRDFSRVTYGLRVKDYNFRGNNEELTLRAETGYSDHFKISYKIPGIGEDRKWGMEMDLSYEKQNDVAFGIENNLLSHISSDNSTLKRETQIGGAITYRPGINLTQSLNLDFFELKVAEEVLGKNSHYLNPFNPDDKHRYFKAAYKADYDRRERVDYPLEGYRLTGETGLKKTSCRSSPVAFFEASIKGFLSPAQNTFLAGSIRSSATLSGKLPFIHQEALGYEDSFLRGYEYQVMRGNAYTINKLEAKYRVLDLKLDFSNLIPFRQFQVMPVEVFVKAHSDQGYINNHYSAPENPLENQFLHGYGAGLDIVTFYDTTLRLEYSLTNTGNEGLFIHTGTGI